MDFQFANKSELEFGVTMHELCAAEGLAIYINKNRHNECFFTSNERFAEIIGIGTETEEDQDALNYAVNVCSRLFPHQVKMVQKWPSKIITK